MFEHYLKNIAVANIGNTGSTITLDGIVKDRFGVTARSGSNPVTGVETRGVKLTNYIEEIELPTLLAWAFKPLLLPTAYWKDLKVGYADSDKTNLHPSNLVWLYPPEYLKDKNGFCVIPMYSRYKINRRGVVIDTETGSVLKQHYRSGYFSVNVKNDYGVWRASNRHRLSATAFNGYPENVDSLTVDHKDSIPGHDVPNNLQFVTQTENNKLGSRLPETGFVGVIMGIYGDPSVFHCQTEFVKELRSIGLEANYDGNNGRWYDVEKKRSVIIKGLKPSAQLDVKNGIVCQDYSGVETIVYSRKECSELIGITITSITDILKNNDQRYNSKGWRIKVNDVTVPWISDIQKKGSIPIACRCVYTGKVDIYPSLRECGAAVGLTLSAMTLRIEDKTQLVWPEEKQYKLAEDPTPWREVKDLKEELGKNSKTVQKKILVRYADNTVKEYGNINDFSKEHGIFVETARYWTKFDKPVWREIQKGTHAIVLLKWNVREDFYSLELTDSNITRGSGKQVRITEVATGISTVCKTGREAASRVKVAPSGILYYLKTGGVFNGYRYEYVLERKNPSG